MTWAQKYIGLPFAEGGRGPQAFDCWGLVRHVLKQECGLEIEPFANIATNDGAAVEAQITAEIGRIDWQEVTEPQAFDVAVLWVNRPFSRTLSHIGLVERPGRLLHVEKDKRTVCVSFRKLGPAFKLERFYRHKELSL